MEYILDKQSREKLIWAEEGLLDICKKTAAGTDAAPYEDERLLLIPGYGHFSWHHRLHLKAAPDEAVFSIIRAEMEKQGRNLIVSFSPELIGKEAAVQLSELGFICFNRQAGMILTGTPLVPALLPGEEYSVTGITEADIPEWAAACERAFEKPIAEEPLYRFLRNPDCRMYACRHEGRIIATTLLNRSKYTAGLHEVSTLQEFRCRGIATKLILKAIHDSYSAGSTAAGLQASELGLGVYRAIGFEKVSTICHYKLP